MNKLEAAKNKMQQIFQTKGLILGLVSGITFGLFGFLIAKTGKYNPLLTSGLILAPVIGCVLSDSLAGIILLVYNIFKGKYKEIARTIHSKPGKMIMIGAIAGGPIANAAYLVGIANAGAAYAIPASAAFPLVGAVLARILFKEKIILRVFIGMILTVIGIIVISYQAPSGNNANFYLGISLAIVAAIGWGIEGAISSFGGGLLDPSISINIRQFVSGILFLLIITPLVAMISHFGFFDGWLVLFKSICNPKILLIVCISALIYSVSFLTWYQSFAIIGTAKTMALNATYVFWGIVFAILIDHESLTNLVLIGAPIILIGTIIVCVNPLDFFKKKAK